MCQENMLHDAQQGDCICPHMLACILPGFTAHHTPHQTRSAHSIPFSLEMTMNWKLLVTPALCIQEEELKTAYPLSITWASHMAQDEMCLNFTPLSSYVLGLGMRRH